MTDYQRILESAEQHLHALKASGVRFLAVDSTTMSALNEAPRRIFNPLPVLNGNSEGLINSPSQPEPIPRNGKLQPGPFQQRAAASAALATVANEPAALTAVTASTEQPLPSQAVILSYDGMSDVTGVGAGTEAGIEDLRQRALVCLKCPHLVKSRRNVVFGVGDVRARLMFVGEAPGADEDARGEPFVGAAGQLLTRIITTMGLSRDTVYIANILKCRPDTPGQVSGNRKPTPDEMKTCLPYLLAQIDLIKPSVLVALGSTAIEGLLGKGEGIGKLRGKFQTFRDIPLMPTFHPAYLLRNQALSEKRKVWEDMLKVMEKLEMPISEKQQGYFLK